MPKCRADCVALQQRRSESAPRTAPKRCRKWLCALNFYIAFTKVERDSLALLPLRTMDKEGRTMKSLPRKIALIGATLAGLSTAAGHAQADAWPTPAMAGPLAANPSPASIDLPHWLGNAARKVDDAVVCR